MYKWKRIQPPDGYPNHPIRYVSDPNDAGLRAYQDSLYQYNLWNQIQEIQNRYPPIHNISDDDRIDIIGLMLQQTPSSHSARYAFNTNPGMSRHTSYTVQYGYKPVQPIEYKEKENMFPIPAKQNLSIGTQTKPVLQYRKNTPLPSKPVTDSEIWGWTGTRKDIGRVFPKTDGGKGWEDVTVDDLRTMTDDQFGTIFPDTKSTRQGIIDLWDYKNKPKTYTWKTK